MSENNKDVVTIDQVIEELQQVRQERGNIEVRIKYADDGGYYYGNGQYDGIIVDKNENDEDCVVIYPY